MESKVVEKENDEIEIIDLIEDSSEPANASSIREPVVAAMLSAALKLPHISKGFLRRDSPSRNVARHSNVKASQFPTTVTPPSKAGESPPSVKQGRKNREPVQVVQDELPSEKQSPKAKGQRQEYQILKEQEQDIQFVKIVKKERPWFKVNSNSQGGQKDLHDVVEGGDEDEANSEEQRLLGVQEEQCLGLDTQEEQNAEEQVNQSENCEKIQNVIEVNKKVVSYMCRICSVPVASVQLLIEHWDKVHNIQLQEPPRFIPSNLRSEKEDLENVSKLLESLESKPVRPRSRPPFSSSSRSINSKHESEIDDSNSHKIQKMQKGTSNVPDSSKNVKWLRCDVCFMDFSELYWYEDHKRMHSEGRFIQCQFCGKNFLFEYHLKDHLKFALQPQSGMNELSGENANLEIGITSNMTTANESKSDVATKELSLEHKCSNKGCSSSFENRKCLLFHLIHHDGLHRCTTCEKTFDREPFLRQHTYKYHHTHIHQQRIKTFKEPQKASYNSSIKLAKKRLVSFPRKIVMSEVPIRSFLKNGQSYSKCPFCNLEFKGPKGNLTMHIQVMHSQKSEGSRPYICPKCPSKFPCSFLTQFNLNQHLSKFHDVQSKNVNGFCEKNEASHWNLFQCPKCPCSYSSKINLKNHIKRHDTDCNNQHLPTTVESSPNNSLNDFVKNNTELMNQSPDENIADDTEENPKLILERPFLCMLCPKRFTDQKYRKRHFNRFHLPPGKKQVPAICKTGKKVSVGRPLNKLALARREKVIESSAVDGLPVRRTRKTVPSTVKVVVANPSSETSAEKDVKPQSKKTGKDDPKNRNESESDSMVNKIKGKRKMQGSTWSLFSLRKRKPT